MSKLRIKNGANSYRALKGAALNGVQIGTTSISENEVTPVLIRLPGCSTRVQTPEGVLEKGNINNFSTFRANRSLETVLDRVLP